MTVGNFPGFREKAHLEGLVHLSSESDAVSQEAGDEDCHYKLVMPAVSTEMMDFTSSSSCVANMAAMLVPPVAVSGAAPRV